MEDVPIAVQSNVVVPFAKPKLHIKDKESCPYGGNNVVRGNDIRQTSQGARSTYVPVGDSKRAFSDRIKASMTLVMYAS